MPEEKKKESFTFSDKIKNSKQVASKSFGNRITSKIGSDGKPHQTLFERTKRDAPFFIAALVALLLLPFLYKYSGQVEDEPTMVTPSYDDAILNPDRSGFDFTGTDPEGQIAQLAGRDSMDLIVGFGKRHSNEEESADSLDEIYRNGLSDSSANSSYARNDMDEETNTTNIYKVRKKAPAQTRASVRRATTKINKLGGAGVARGSGGRVPFTWGGSLKNAANKVRSNGPVNSPKPVSLQPLQAAGKPSRSYFGNGAAAEARRSKDAMSKGNAMQALMDAQMKPVDPGRVGGITGGDFGGPGGGNGNLHREFNYKGEKPWWWDLMKTRSQMQWEARFKRGWKYIDALDDVLINIGKGLLNCLLTGDDGGDVAHFFGAKAGEGSGAKCGELTEAEWADCSECQKYGKKMNKKSCKNYLANLSENSSMVKKGWQDSKKRSEDQSFVGVRLGCLGLNWGKFKEKIKGEFTAAQGDLNSGTSCESFMRDGKYEPALMVDNVHKNVWGKTRDDASKWDIWIYIVGLKAGDLNKYYRSQTAEKEAMLQILYLSHRDSFEAGEVGDRHNLGADDIPLFIESAAVLGSRKLGDVSSSSKSSGSKAGASSQEEQQLRSDLSSWENKLTRAKTDAERKQCQEMITNIQTRLAQIGRTQSLQKGSSAAVSSDGKDGPDMNKARVGMSYKEFLKVLANGGFVTTREDEAGNPTEFRELKSSKKGKYFVTGGRCNYPYARISCDVRGTTMDDGSQDNKGRPVAYLQFYNGMSQKEAYEKMKDRFVVSYKVLGADGADNETVHSDEKGNRTRWFPLGVKNFSQDKNGRAVIAADHTVEGLLKDGIARVQITWQIRQCGDVLLNGDSVTKGGCNAGKVSVSTTDKDGNTKTSWDGQDVPGIVVSEASCFYGDTDKVYTTNPGTTECTGDVRLPKEAGQKCQWIQRCKSGKLGVPELEDPSCKEDEPDPGTGKKALSVVSFNSSMKGMPQNPLDPNDRPAPANKKWESCKITDGTKLLKLDEQTKQYFAAAKEKFDKANANQNVTLSYSEDGLTVPNLVDAILIDPNNGTVPANTVCLLGKTIGGNAVAPATPQGGFDNLFGAFLAFITYDAVARPTQKTHDKNGRRIDDLRFGWSTKDYWWGGYIDVGDRSYYVDQIDNGMWQGLPLKELEREQLPAYSVKKLKQSDNQNRKDFQRIYNDLTNKEPCQYPAEKTVSQAKVLEYITRLCEYGDYIMPKSSPIIRKKYAGKDRREMEVSATGNKTPEIPAR